MPQGSRELGILESSSLFTVVRLPTFLVSTTGVSAVTVMLSSTAATLRGKLSWTFWPTATITSRLTVVKPVRVTVSLCVPWGTLRKRKSPWVPEVVERDPCGPESVTAAPGITAPESSVTEP